MFILDCNKGPFGQMQYSITLYLEVDGERYNIESAYTKSTAKALAEKWEKHAKTLALPLTTTQEATKFMV